MALAAQIHLDDCSPSAAMIGGPLDKSIWTIAVLLDKSIWTISHRLFQYTRWGHTGKIQVWRGVLAPGGVLS
jgi:hypothetical protein